jgi:zinc protease
MSAQSSLLKTPAVKATPPKASERVQRLHTPSGIEIWHVEDYTVPVISLECAFLGGAAQDPQGLCGLGNLLTGLLDEGAGKLDSQAFQEELEDKAIELSFDAGRDRFSASLRCLAETAGPAFDLLGLALKSPRFDAGAIDRVRSQIISGLKRDENDPAARARDRFNALAFPGHTYGRPSDGTIGELGAITRDAILRQHAALFTRDTLMVVAVGAIAPGDLVAKVESAFGGLPAKGSLVPVAPVEVQNLGKREVIDIDVPQSTLYLALPGIGRKDPDFIPAMVLNHILGGGSFTSRLWTEVREKRGLAYSVWSMLSNRAKTSTFLAGTATSNERLAESLEVMLKEIRQIAKKGATAAELEKARSYQMGSYALRFDTSRKIAAQLLEMRVEDLGIDYMDRRNDEIAAVTLDAMSRAGTRLFAGVKPLVVVAGRPTGL